MDMRRQWEKYRVSVKNVPVAREAVCLTFVGIFSIVVSDLIQGRDIDFGYELLSAFLLYPTIFFVVILLRRWAGDRQPRLF